MEPVAYARFLVKDKFTNQLLDANEYLFEHLAENASNAADQLWNCAQGVEYRASTCLTEHGQKSYRRRHKFDMLEESAILMDKAVVAFQHLADLYKMKSAKTDEDRVRELKIECAKLGYKLVPADDPADAVPKLEEDTE